MSTLDTSGTRRTPRPMSRAMSPRFRKLLLTTHVVCSVGWIGAVVAFLVLSIAGLASRDADTVRGAYLAMDLIGGYVIVPMSLASLATGLLQALGTRWGLLRHYWVLTKFLLAVLATTALMVHQFVVVARQEHHRLPAHWVSSLPATPRSLSWCCSRPRLCRCTNPGAGPATGNAYSRNGTRCHSERQPSPATGSIGTVPAHDSRRPSSSSASSSRCWGFSWRGRP